LSTACSESLSGEYQRRQRFDSLDIRLDRIESAVHETKSNFHALRADFNELRNVVKEHFPVIH